MSAHCPERSVDPSIKARGIETLDFGIFVVEGQFTADRLTVDWLTWSRTRMVIGSAAGASPSPDMVFVLD